MPVRLTHPDNRFTVHQRQPRQFTGLRGDALDDRLGDIRDAREAQEFESVRRHAHGQDVPAVIGQLTDIPAFNKFGEQTVARAARQGQGIRNGYEANAFALRRQQIENSQTVFE